MLYMQIKNYDEFRAIFGTRRSSRGCIVNKILLSFWKYRYNIDKDGRATQIRDLQSLYNLVITELRRVFDKYPGGTYRSLVSVGNLTLRFCSKNYQLFSGLGSVDLSNPKNIVYVDYSHQNKKYSMGAGKFFRKILIDNKVRLDEATITYCSEEFQRQWEGETRKLTEGLELHVNQHFDWIYSQSHCDGNFASCMVGKSQHSFYKNSVKASAAYLTKNGKIVARCIVYHDVYTMDGQKHNYAERQYATNGNEILKTILVNKLLEAGIIDIYKTIGAGCRETQAIMDKNGVRLPDPRLKTRCIVKHGEVKSFLDTFKYFYPTQGILTNFLYLREVYVEMDHTTSTFRDPACRMIPYSPIDRSDLPNID